MLYGVQLRQNYDDMLRKFAKLAKLGTAASLPRNMTLETKCRSNGQAVGGDQVAMDFTGRRGKLVTNSKEIEQLANTRRKPRLTRRLSSNHFISDSSASPGSELIEETWFHGRITREQALESMKKEGIEDGLFLVRESSSATEVFVLTFCMNKKVFHCQLVQDIGPGNEMVCSLDKGPAFPCVADLIYHYRQKPINGISVALRKSCAVRRRNTTACI